MGSRRYRTTRVENQARLRIGTGNDSALAALYIPLLEIEKKILDQ
jgi:hypothetical protein